MRPRDSRNSHTPVVVMYVIGGLACGGAEMVLVELIRGLDRERFRPVVVSLKGPDVLSEQIRAAGADLHHLHMQSRSETPRAVARVARLARRINPGVVHGIMFYGDFVCRALKLVKPGVRVVGAVHSTYVGPPRSRALLRATDGLVDAVTAVSGAVAEHHLQLRTTRPDKIVVIANGIDERRFAAPSKHELDELRHKLGLEGKHVLLTVGRHEKEKNFPLLLRAFAQLESPDAVLLMVGDGSLRQDLEREAHSLGVEERVRFLGHVAPVNPLLHVADVFVMSSDIEGLPLVMLEAMAAGLPMVLTRVGGIPDVVEHEKTALLVPAGDAAGLAAAFRRMLTMPEGEKATLIEAARDVFRKRFSVQKMVDDTQSLYAALLDGSPPPVESRAE